VTRLERRLFSFRPPGCDSAMGPRQPFATFRTSCPSESSRTSAVFCLSRKQASPWDFRLFLPRDVALLRVLSHWTIRLLFPKPLVKARHAYLRAVREHLATTIDGRWTIALTTWACGLFVGALGSQD
jgi:hypothetical protein